MFAKVSQPQKSSSSILLAATAALIFGTVLSSTAPSANAERSRFCAKATQGMKMTSVSQSGRSRSKKDAAVVTSPAMIGRTKKTQETINPTRLATNYIRCLPRQV